MILSEVREARPHSSRQPTLPPLSAANAEATVLQLHWVTAATMLCYAMNVICLPGRALTGDFGTGIAGLSLLSRFGHNICTATPSPRALEGLIPLAVPIFRRSMTGEETKPDDAIYIRPTAVYIPQRFLPS